LFPHIAKFPKRANFITHGVRTCPFALRCNSHSEQQLQRTPKKPFEASQFNIPSSPMSPDWTPFSSQASSSSTTQVDRPWPPVSSIPKNSMNEGVSDEDDTDEEPEI
jgi:hypothetical protein